MEKKGEAFFSVASGEWQVAGAKSETPVASGWWLVASAESETPVASVLFSKFIINSFRRAWF